MTLADTREVLFENRVLSNRTQTEQVEARNHQAALMWLLDQLGDKNFAVTEGLIQGLHLRMMNGIASDAGRYRRHSVRIARTRVVTANHVKVPQLIAEFANTATPKTRDLVSKIARTHAEFERIHPFGDGNGRVGRLLMVAQALKHGIIPPLVLKEKRFAYYRHLELAQTKDECRPLEYFIADAIVTADRLLRPSRRRGVGT